MTKEQIEAVLKPSNRPNTKFVDTAFVDAVYRSKSSTDIQAALDAQWEKIKDHPLVQLANKVRGFNEDQARKEHVLSAIVAVAMDFETSHEKRLAAIADLLPVSGPVN